MPWLNRSYGGSTIKASPKDAPERMTNHKQRWPLPLAMLYAAYAWIAFFGCVLVAIMGALLLPGLERRRRWVTASARTSLWLCAISARIEGMERLPQGHCIVVANHASYLDGVILQAFLPPRFSYVIKGEMQNVPVVHFLLRRIGAKFVERFVASGSARDARALLKAAAAGESLAFFPEGTFVSEPGLGRFRPGAFAAAIKGALPIVPLAIVGARQVLPGGTLLPRPGRLTIQVLEAIPPDHAAFASSAALAETARQRILRVLGEPDLLK
jgi:1-acyl-sn-glycerol-3-phosphate acyltransferase